MDPQISIIVPVYKVEKYIDECVQSILKQSYSVWELILVDDGSPDRCGEICEHYAAKDDRIKVIHKSNGGLSDARNVALDIINGKYVTFIDSDDFISRTYLEEMVRFMKVYDADIVQCEFTRNRNSIENQTSEDDITVLYSEKILREFLRFGAPKVFACGKLYKSSIFNSIRFPVGIIDEDNFTTYKTFIEASIFVNINKCLYYYRPNEASITNRNFEIHKFDILNCVNTIRDYLEDRSKIYSEDIDYYEMRQLVQIYNNAIVARAEKMYVNELQEVKERIHAITINDLYMETKYRFMVFILLNYSYIYKKMVLFWKKMIR